MMPNQFLAEFSWMMYFCAKALEMLKFMLFFKIELQKKKNYN